MSDVTETVGPSSLVIVTESARAATIVQPEADTVTESVGPASLVVVGETVTTSIVAVGMQGPVGARGAAGTDGTNGTNGTNGVTGPRGDTGPQGETGIQGPQGPEGGSTIVYYQSVPATTATIVHNLGKYPAVVTVTSAGDVVEGDVDYIDANSLTVTFSAPFSWTAYLD